MVKVMAINDSDPDLQACGEFCLRIGLGLFVESEPRLEGGYSPQLANLSTQRVKRN
jgi:hypothetical protein